MSTDLDWLQAFLPKLRCPHTREPLVLEAGWLVNQSRTHRYPVVEGIPHLLPGSAVTGESFAETGKNPLAL